MSSLLLFSQLWPLIPATYTMAKTVLGGVQIGAFVTSSLNDKEHLKAMYPHIREWNEKVKAAVEVMTIADPVHRHAMQTFLEANDDAVELYKELARRT